MARLRIGLLGGFEARWESEAQPIPLHSRKVSGLLAFLAHAAGTGQPRELLATMLWDRSPQEQARASLRQALAVLRKSIAGPANEVLVADHVRVALTPDQVWVDTRELQRLAADGTPEALLEASSLCRGRFLEGFSVESELFEDWARAESQRLHDLMVRSLASLLTLHLQAGAFDAANDVAHRILAFDPVHEDAHRTLISVYARQGMRGEALKHYERHRQTMRREFGLEPETKTAQLAQQIRDDHPLVTAAAPERSSSPEDASPYPNGRRFITMLTCSLVDAALLSTRLDPEELRSFTETFDDGCLRPIRQRGGHVIHRADYTLTACFGYPRVDEHDAERAVRAALGILEGFRLGKGRLPVPPMQVRIGIATGEVVVVVCERAGGDGPPALQITGGAPHVAAGLRASADPDCVLVAESTRRLLGELFVYQGPEERTLPGFDTPFPVWRVLHERAGQNRFAATRGGARLAPLIGRDEERELLLGRWALARSGRGQVVVLTGEPGIGKSRLVDALRRTIDVEACHHVVYGCSPHHQDSAFYPVIRQIEEAANLLPDDTPTVKLDKLEALLRRVVGDGDAGVPLIANLLSIPAADRYAPSGLTPQRQKEKTLEVLDTQLADLSRSQPMLLVFEDLHWSDPSTRELLAHLVESADSRPMLILVTHRHGTRVPWTDEPHVSSVLVKRLDRSSSEALVAALADGLALPAETLARIVNRADGVPLFLEELTKNAVESDGRPGLDGMQGPVSADPAIGIPDALQDLLQARLDRLGPGKVAAQEAAVIGRSFGYELLAAVSALSDVQLRDALACLADGELIHARGSPPHAGFRFKHALVQDAAYASLLRADRASLHERIAAAYEHRFSQALASEPEVVAHHFAEAGFPERAIPYWQSAGERAAGRWAYREAIAYFDKALAALDRLAATDERHGREVALRLALGQAWILAAGYTVPEVEAAFDRARALCEQLGQVDHLFFIQLGLWQLYTARQEMERASAAADRLLALAETLQRTEVLIEAHVAHVVTSYSRGVFEVALAHANASVALEVSAEHRGRILSAGYDGRVISLTGASWSLWVLGYPDMALSRMQEALAEARRLAHPYSQVMALYTSAWLHVFRREPQATLDQAEQTIAISHQYGFGWAGAYATVLRGWALAELDQADGAIPGMQQALGLLARMGHSMWQPNLLGKLATALDRAGRRDEAVAVLTQALENADRTDEREHAAELHRLMGTVVLRRGTTEATAAAEHSFLRAVEIAHAQKARAWELRAATSLAALWRDQGRSRQARDLLAPLHARFTEGFRTPDLQDAAALLGALDDEAD